MLADGWAAQRAGANTVTFKFSRFRRGLRRGQASVRRLILNLHLFIALIAGAFMVILGVTGSIMEFEPELDRSLHPQLSYVTPGRRSPLPERSR